jgi:magnesium transporter
MARFIKKRIGARGTQPGSLILIGEQQIEQAEIKVIQYDATSVNEQVVESIEEAISMLDPKFMTWINVFGLHDTQLINALGEKLSIDNLVLEDLIQTIVQGSVKSIRSCSLLPNY